MDYSDPYFMSYGNVAADQMPNMAPGMPSMPQQYSMGSGMPSGMDIQPHYARGGRVGLGHLAELLRSQGEGQDTVLAHIHPVEAMELQRKYGGNVNPKTGLPQYGLKLGKIFKAALPFIAAAAGTALGGPLGGAAASSATQGLMGSSKNRFKNLGIGALKGGALGYAMPHLGGMMGVNPGGAMGQFMNMGGTPGMSRLTGLSQYIPGMGGSNTAAMGAAGNLMNGQAGETAEKTWVDRLKEPVNAGLLGATILGMVSGERRIAKHKDPTIQEAMGASKTWGPEHQYRRIKPVDRGLGSIYSEPNGVFDPEFKYFDDVNPEAEYYNHGGYIAGHSGGQDDKVNARVSDGEYVMDASTVSDLGDGNNAAGAKKLDQMRLAVRRQKRTSGSKLPPKAKSLGAYLKAR